MSTHHFFNKNLCRTLVHSLNQTQNHGSHSLNASSFVRYWIFLQFDRVFDGILVQAILFDPDDGLPVELARVLDSVEGGIGGTVEDDIEPIILFEALGRIVLVRGKGDFAGDGAALDFDETDINRSFGVLRVRQAGDEVEPTVFGFDALDHAALGFLVLDRSEERRVGKEGRSRWSPYH